jgi:hypothetical protein
MITIIIISRIPLFAPYYRTRTRVESKHDAESCGTSLEQFDNEMSNKRHSRRLSCLKIEAQNQTHLAHGACSIIHAPRWMALKLTSILHTHHMVSNSFLAICTYRSLNKAAVNNRTNQ